MELHVVEHELPLLHARHRVDGLVGQLVARAEGVEAVARERDREHHRDLLGGSAPSRACMAKQTPGVAQRIQTRAQLALDRAAAVQRAAERAVLEVGGLPERRADRRPRTAPRRRRAGCRGTPRSMPTRPSISPPGAKLQRRARQLEPRAVARRSARSAPRTCQRPMRVASSAKRPESQGSAGGSRLIASKGGPSFAASFTAPGFGRPRRRRAASCPSSSTGRPAQTPRGTSKRKPSALGTSSPSTCSRLHSSVGCETQSSSSARRCHSSVALRSSGSARSSPSHSWSRGRPDERRLRLRLAAVELLEGAHVRDARERDLERGSARPWIGAARHREREPIAREVEPRVDAAGEVRFAEAQRRGLERGLDAHAPGRASRLWPSAPRAARPCPSRQRVHAGELPGLDAGRARAARLRAGLGELRQQARRLASRRKRAELELELRAERRRSPAPRARPTAREPDRAVRELEIARGVSAPRRREQRAREARCGQVELEPAAGPRRPGSGPRRACP